MATVHPTLNAIKSALITPYLRTGKNRKGTGKVQERERQRKRERAREKERGVQVEARRMADEIGKVKQKKLGGK